MIFAELTGEYALLLIGCFVWIPVIAMMFFFISSMIMAEIDVGTGFVGLAFSLALGFFAFKPPDPSLTPVIFVFSVSSLIAIPILRWLLNRADLHNLQLENVENAYEALAQKSNNIGAQIKLAKAIHTRGMHSHAIAMLEKALTGMDAGLFSDDLRMLRQWRQHVQPSEFRTLTCVGCGHENQPGSIFCATCSRPYLLDYARGWTSGGLVRKISAGWIGAVGLGFGIPLASKSLPPGAALVVIPVLVIGAGVLLWAAFKTSARMIS